MPARRYPGPIRPLLFTLAVVLHASGWAKAQILREWSGSFQDQFGVMDGLGDVNGDGVSEVAIAAPGTTIPGLGRAGQLWLYSGADGRALYALRGSRQDEWYGITVSGAGDLDRDGWPDFFAGRIQVQSGRVVYSCDLRSGPTGALIRTYHDSGVPTAVGDVNQDGYPDILFGDPAATVNGMLEAGRAELISGGDGSALRTFNGMRPDHGFGNPARAGDFDGDGVPDLLIWAAGGSLRSTANDGFWAYSGRTGNLLLRVAPPGGTDTFPFSLVGPGDLDGDGLDDIVVADLGPSQLMSYSQIDGYGGPAGPRLFALRFDPPANTSMGSTLLPTGDVDGDGHDDFFTHGGYDKFVLSGRDRSVLRDFSGGGWPGYYHNPVGDVNGDDFPDVLLGGPVNQQPDEQLVRIYSGAPNGVVAFGTGCPDGRGIVPRIGASYIPRPGLPFALNLSRVHASSSAAIIIGRFDQIWNGTSLPLDLATIGMPGCWLRTSPDLLSDVPVTGSGELGRASVRLTLPSDPALRGRTLYAQWLVLDPATRTGSTTRALAVTVR